jgi:peptide-methionine (S)-S-oxide reductase
MKMRTVWGLSLITALIVGAGAAHAVSPRKVETATFAGGCFWCVESDFDKVEGVISTTSGYTGGHQKNPTYKEVSAGGTGHTEAVQIVYDPTKVTYDELLKVYWRNIDPTTPNRQFCDAGSQYRAEIFYHDERQKDLAEQSKREVDSTKPFEARIVTQITVASEFYAAETYHQDYYLKNPVRYKIYRYGCGRDKRLKQLWGSTG